MLEENKYMTPRQIVAELDKYIIGQDDAKRNVAIALRNRWRRMNVASDIKEEIIPNNILMIGATGVGKTEVTRQLAMTMGIELIRLAVDSGLFRPGLPECAQCRHFHRQFSR